MILMTVKILMGLWQPWPSLAATQGFVPPKANLSQEAKPDLSSYAPQSQKLFQALLAGDEASSSAFFFPENIFLELKAIADPLGYFKQLKQWYSLDWNREREALQKLEQARWLRFKPGHCRWKEAGSEANRFAYWSCYKSRIEVESLRQNYSIEIRTLINWDDQWYITHLGAIPKQK